MHLISSVMETSRAAGLRAPEVLLAAKPPSEQPNPARGPGVLEETTMRYKVNGSDEMTHTSLVRALPFIRQSAC
jgi:hypothetical protein